MRNCPVFHSRCADKCAHEREEMYWFEYMCTAQAQQFSEGFSNSWILASCLIQFCNICNLCFCVAKYSHLAFLLTEKQRKCKNKDYFAKYPRFAVPWHHLIIFWMISEVQVCVRITSVQSKRKVIPNCNIFWCDIDLYRFSKISPAGRST